MPPTFVPQLLIVDDDPHVRRVLAAALPIAGFAVRTAAGGDEAVAVFREHGPSVDLVLLDVIMPGGPDGLQTLAALRAIDPGVRCCFMSGHAAAGPEDVLRAAGALDVFPKPFPDLARLASRLRELVGQG